MRGRPRVTCSSRCRQVRYRRALLRNSTADGALRANGFDGERLLALAHKVAQDELRRRGAFPGGRYEDLVGYLCACGCAAAAGYDARRSSDGYSFASFLYDVLKQRVVDYYRRKSEGFADTRYRANRVDVVFLGDGADVLAAAHGGDGVCDPDDDMDAAVDALASRLSPGADWTLQHVVTALADGARIGEAAAGAGISIPRAKQQLAELREELAAVRN
jgi:hypothetical protein